VSLSLLRAGEKQQEKRKVMGLIQIDVGCGHELLDAIYPMEQICLKLALVGGKGF